jgi:SAM-dependent methyltransferase
MGGLLAFRVGNFDNTAEREQFRFLCEQLKAHYEKSNEFCVLAGNYNIGCELDALFIKTDAIIAIEFKNYGGKVIANENGEWTCDDKVIKGGSRKTVLQQARINHSIIKKELKAIGVSEANIKDVPTLIIFNQPVEITNNLSATNKSWLHITDNEHVLEKLDNITCPHTDLGPLGIVNLAETLNLNSFYLTEFSNATYDTHRKPIENIDLFEDIKEFATQVKEEIQNETKEEKNDLNLDSFVIEDEDSIALSEFVKKIVSLSLKLDNFTVKVLDSTKAFSSFVAHGIRLTQEYAVTISADGIGAHCAKLARFTNHDVKAISPSTIFWEEGERIAIEGNCSSGAIEEHQSKKRSNTNNSNVSFRKLKTVLPHWLDKKIFNDHQAIYAPEHERYEYNLNLNDEELRVYLGTYFPRSYAEMFCIVDNLLQNKYLKETLKQDEISVLDFGCGTGGEILGLITAIGRHLPHAKINITAIDGNDGALAILKDLVNSNPNKDVQVALSSFSQTLSSFEDVERLAFEKRYHFVLCDKMVCELISKEVLPINAYAIMAKKLTTFLHENGLLIILDVTTKDEHSGYFYPQLMNYAINDYIRKSRTIETLLPLSCACHDECKDFCFMQQTFKVSHSHKSNDESKVCYRVLCKKSLKAAVMQGIETVNLVHIIHPTKYKQNDDSAICSQSKNNEIIIDTFNINL